MLTPCTARRPFGEAVYRSRAAADPAFELALLDFNMPEMYGLSLATEICKLSAAARITPG